MHFFSIFRRFLLLAVLILTLLTTRAITHADTVSSWYKPGIDITWQWQLEGKINPNYAVDIYDIDLFDTPAGTIASLKASGKKVLCYFSAGSSENWRPDFTKFSAASLGKKNGWAGEKWLDIRSKNVADVMLTRLDLAVKKGCDGVEPDNVDGFSNKTGFPLKAGDQIVFNRWLAKEAHARGLTVALKNTGDLANQLVDSFDLAINEECHAYQECDQLAVFTKQGKPILNAEYKKMSKNKIENLCKVAVSNHIQTLILSKQLNDSRRISCN